MDTKQKAQHTPGPYWIAKPCTNCWEIHGEDDTILCQIYADDELSERQVLDIEFIRQALTEADYTSLQGPMSRGGLKP